VIHAPPHHPNLQGQGAIRDERRHRQKDFERRAGAVKFRIQAMQNCRVPECPFDFKSGTVTHNTWAVDEKIPLADQLWEYGGDLFQVKYRTGDLVLDIKWKQNGKVKSGRFMVRLVEGANWEKPINISTTSSLRGLKRIMKNTVYLAESIGVKASLP
jgi:hypothetical protein